MSEAEDPSQVDTPTLVRSVQETLHNAKFARTELGRLNFIEFALNTQREIVRRETDAHQKGEAGA